MVSLSRMFSDKKAGPAASSTNNTATTIATPIERLVQR
jgi:hypothetical protein